MGGITVASKNSACRHSEGRWHLFAIGRTYGGGEAAEAGAEATEEGKDGMSDGRG